MNMNFKSWLVGTTMLVMGTTGAFAEVVFNRGNSADPESLDPHKTSTVYEAHILRDLFSGPDDGRRQGRSHPGRRRKLDRVAMTARFTRSSCAPERLGPMARPSPPMISSSPGSALLIRQPPLNMPICWRRW